jgi:hypothetical protein
VVYKEQSVVMDQEPPSRGKRAHALLSTVFVLMLQDMERLALVLQRQD